MKAGDLVSVKQRLGCFLPPKIRDRGVGLVLKVLKTPLVDIGTAQDVYLGDDIVVSLASGVVETFNEGSVELINEAG